MALRRQHFQDTTGQIHLGTYIDYENNHKTCTNNSSQKNPSIEERKYKFLTLPKKVFMMGKRGEKLLQRGDTVCINH